MSTMPYSISAVRFTTNFVLFDQTAVRISAIESVEKIFDDFDNRWRLKIRMNTGKRYEFIFRNSVDNYFDRLTS